MILSSCWYWHVGMWWYSFFLQTHCMLFMLCTQFQKWKFELFKQNLFFFSCQIRLQEADCDLDNTIYTKLCNRQHKHIVDHVWAAVYTNIQEIHVCTSFFRGMIIYQRTHDTGNWCLYFIIPLTPCFESRQNVLIMMSVHPFFHPHLFPFWFSLKLLITTTWYVFFFFRCNNQYVSQLSFLYSRRNLRRFITEKNPSEPSDSPGVSVTDNGCSSVSTQQMWHYLLILDK